MIEIRVLAEAKNAQALADKLHIICDSNDHAYRILQAMLTSPMMFDSTLWGTPLIATHLRNIGMEKPFINEQGHYLSYWYWVKPIAVYMRSIMRCGNTNVPAFKWTDPKLRIKDTGFKNPYGDLGDIWATIAPITGARPMGATAQRYPYITYELEMEETEVYYTKMEHNGVGTYEGRYVVEDGNPEDLLDEEGRDIEVEFNGNDYRMGDDVDHEIINSCLRVTSLFLHETPDRVHDLNSECPMCTDDVQGFIDDILEEGNEDWLVT